ncbi:MAG: carbohydrate kinase family protein [Methanosarcinaceae archaeon]|nr:carbohydrate kinase family protein [Methanosarcinaceae archaeon]
MYSDNKRKIYVSGHTSIDYLLTVDKIVSENRSSPISSLKTYPGGGAANVAAAIATLGSSVGLISPVGTDFESSGYKNNLEKMGVDLSYVTELEGEQLSKAFVITDSENNQSTYFYWGAAGRLDEITPPKVDILHIATAECNFNAKIAELAGFVSFDPGQDLITYTKEPLLKILKHTNILFANKHEIELLSKISDLTFEEIIEMIEIVVITKDKEGSVLYMNSEEIVTPIVEVETVDPTGAGDSYKAGFLVAYFLGYSPEICSRVGATTSSFVVEKVGCQTNLPDWETMKKRYNENFPNTDLK